MNSYGFTKLAIAQHNLPAFEAIIDIVLSRQRHVGISVFTSLPTDVELYLQLCAEMNAVECAKYLLNRGDVDVNSQNRIDLHTPLHIAICRNNLEVTICAEISIGHFVVLKKVRVSL